MTAPAPRRGYSSACALGPQKVTGFLPDVTVPDFGAAFAGADYDGCISFTRRCAGLQCVDDVNALKNLAAESFLLGDCTV